MVTDAPSPGRRPPGWVRVLYGSETNTAADVAEYVARLLWSVGVPDSTFAAADAALAAAGSGDDPLAALRRVSHHRHPPPGSVAAAGVDAVAAECGDANDTGRGLVVFVVSTTGQGEPPTTIRRLWARLLDPAGVTRGAAAGVRFAVFGLGDSGYQRFNLVAKVLHNRLVQLGGAALVHRGLGDDQDAHGPEDALQPWLSSLLLAGAREGLWLPVEHDGCRLGNVGGPEGKAAVAQTLESVRELMAAQAVDAGVDAPTEADGKKRQRATVDAGTDDGGASLMEIPGLVPPPAGVLPDWPLKYAATVTAAGAVTPDGEPEGADAPAPLPATEYVDRCRAGCATAGAGTPAMPDWSAATVSTNDRLTAAGHYQRVHRLRIAAPAALASGFRPGDALGVWVGNPPAVVTAVLRRVGLSPADRVTLNRATAAGRRAGDTMPPFPIAAAFSSGASDAAGATAEELATFGLDLQATATRHFFMAMAGQPPPPALTAAAAAAPPGSAAETAAAAALERWAEERERAAELAAPHLTKEFDAYCQREKRTFAEVLADFPGLHLTPAFLFSAVRPMQPRFYSVASAAIGAAPPSGGGDLSPTEVVRRAAALEAALGAAANDELPAGEGLRPAPGELELAVAQLDVTTPWGRRRTGLVSSALVDASVGAQLRVCMRRAPAAPPLPPPWVRLLRAGGRMSPSSAGAPSAGGAKAALSLFGEAAESQAAELLPAAPYVALGPGTGIAPVRSLVATLDAVAGWRRAAAEALVSMGGEPGNRDATGPLTVVVPAAPPVMLFTGHRRSDADDLFGPQWRALNAAQAAFPAGQRWFHYFPVFSREHAAPFAAALPGAPAAAAGGDGAAPASTAAPVGSLRYVHHRLAKPDAAGAAALLLAGAGEEGAAGGFAALPASPIPEAAAAALAVRRRLGGSGAADAAAPGRHALFDQLWSGYFEPRLSPLTRVPADDAAASRGTETAARGTALLCHAPVPLGAGVLFVAGSSTQMPKDVDRTAASALAGFCFAGDDRAAQGWLSALRSAGHYVCDTWS